MASDGTIATVGDAFDLVNGFAFKSADFIESGIPVIKIKNVKAGEFSEQNFSYVGEKFLEKRGDKLARVGDLLISMSGNRHDGSPHTWVGKVAHFNRRGRYFINQRVGALRPKPNVEVDLKYAGYVLASMSYQEHFIAVATSSGGQANLSPSQILGAPLSLPSYAEQYGIGHLISVLDDRIDLLRQTNTTLEAIAQVLFKSWFVDFDPVHAKAEGREPEAMDAATAALFPSEFEESELGLIPKGWRAGKLGDMAKLRGGKQLSRDLFTEDGQFPIFGGAGEMGRANVFNAEGSVMTVGRVGAYCGQFFLHSGAAWVNNNASHVIPHAEYLASTLWIFLALKNSDIDRIKKGAAQPFVSNSDIEGLSLAIPEQACIGAFIRVASTVFERISQVTEHARSLTEFRDTLLPRLISGKLRLPDAERAIEAIA